ncbi:hypothetical protein GGX14DRAFT_656345 [Mycena pura]|uniref:RING-type domain-containing protein n=1 Tax=Mycena pura TaxID=153505 RepID=A0AAD6Y4R3_9AGAR|nr:hypothetical protein GGX14DRAFT_656345 [Mycena pura]
MSSAPRTPAGAPLTPKRASKMASNQSLNHLLNFSLPPRQTQPLPSLPRRSRKTGAHQGVWNKERFVNAQYRFVMNPNGDYTWQDILQVIIPRSSALASAATAGEGEASRAGHTTCPICLSPPTAPRMTKCGHVFCFPCILHYLNTSENKWARCPICFDSVNEKQLKGVKWFDGPLHLEDDAEEVAMGSSSSGSVLDAGIDAPPRVGSTMRMRLMQRPQITTLALPRSHTWPSDLLPPHQAPFHFLPDVFEYAKFMLATPSYLIADLTRNLDELASERRILSSMTDDLGVLFVDAAEAKVRIQLAKAAALETLLLKDRIDKAIRDQREIEGRVAFYENRRKQEATTHSPVPGDIPQELLALRPGTLTSSSESSVQLIPPAGNRNNPRQRRNVNPPPPSTSTYYYYQAASGLPIFLHPLDIKILLSHFSSYALFPDAITIRVDASSEGTVNDDLRKRCKYLAHMPEGADVVFVEADLAGVVGGPEGGLKNFEGPLRMRSARRKERERKDERARVRAEERERDRDRHVLTEAGATTTATWRFAGESPVLDEVVLPPQQQPPSGVAQGAWGSRSFAAAAHSAPTTSQGQARERGGATRQEEHEEDEWNMDAAWHELESRIAGGGAGGGKKRNNNLVVLGGGGPGGRRRR